jgi:hypothetical protein
LERINALTQELGDVKAKLEALLTTELGAVNDALKKAGLEPIVPPPKVAQLDEITPERAAWLRTLKRKQKKSVQVDAVPVQQLRNLH